MMKIFILISILLLSCREYNGISRVQTERFNDSTLHVKVLYSKRDKKEEFYLNQEGRLSGKYYYWNKKGQLISDWNYLDGQRNGQQISWWETGRKSVVENYSDGKLNGMRRCYAIEGELISEELYDMGVRISYKQVTSLYNPDPDILHSFMKIGIDSVTATKIIKNNLSGYVINAEAGNQVIYDTTIVKVIKSLRNSLDTVRNVKKIQ